MDTNALDWLSLFFTIVGALNWGIIGLTALIAEEPLNVIQVVVDSVFLPGAGEVVVALLYLVVGLAGVYLLYTSYKIGRASRRVEEEPELVE